MEPTLGEPRTRTTARVSDTERVVERESVIRLSQKAAVKILPLLDHPPKPHKRLQDAVRKFKGTVRG